MKFGQLVNGEVVYAKLPIIHEGRVYYTSNPEIMLTLGYKEVVHTSHPIATGGKYTQTWAETETQIIQEWEFEAYTEDQLKEQYKNLTVQYIREKYSANQEFAVIREYVAYGEPYKEAFDEYSNYVESCKERAHAAVYV